MLFWRKNILSLAVVIITAIASFIIVKILKKPGSMTVIESQSMDMTAMKPKSIPYPVKITRVEPIVIKNKITYTANVKADEDIDIYPRITGQISYMKAYPGDIVRKNELVVKLDPDNSEYKAKQLEADFNAQASMFNANIANEEFKQKEYEYKATLSDKKAANENLNEALATQKYWDSEIIRQKKMLEDDVISLSEYELQESYYKASQAKAKAAKEKLEAANERSIAAKAAYESMSHHKHHQYNLAQKANAGLLDAKIYNDYTSIRASANAVVTKRLVSPGVTVYPNTLILELARIDKIRVQCEVSEKDASKIKINDPVLIKKIDTKTSVKAKITSLFPASDQEYRTYTIEAYIDNVNKNLSKNSKILSLNDYYFYPGQYVVMEITTDTTYDLAVPNSAIVYRNGQAYVWLALNIKNKNTKTTYTCVMHPQINEDKPGDCPICGMVLVENKDAEDKTAKLVKVTLGLSDNNYTQIISGLKQGDLVISHGYDELTDGDSVTDEDL